MKQILTGLVLGLVMFFLALGTVKAAEEQKAGTRAQRNRRISR